MLHVIWARKNPELVGGKSWRGKILGRNGGDRGTQVFTTPSWAEITGNTIRQGGGGGENVLSNCISKIAERATGQTNEEDGTDGEPYTDTTQ